MRPAPQNKCPATNAKCPEARTAPVRSALAIAILAVVPSFGGCIPAGGTAFRTTALPAIETGVSSILDGVVSGVFAAIAVDPASQSCDNTSSSNDRQ